MTVQNNKLLNNKKGLVLGIANDRSLAWGVAEFVANSGGNLALTYQSEALKKRVVPLSEKIKTKHVYQCDVQDYQDLPIFFQNLSKDFGKLDFIVHGIAFSNKEELKGEYVQTSKENFLMTLEISCYSFTSLVQNALPYLNDGASLLTLPS